jgi:hypothetical protein
VHIEPTEVGHYDVEHSHIRGELLDRSSRVSATITSRDNADVRLSPQNFGDALEHDWMVIRNDDGHRFTVQFLVAVVFFKETANRKPPRLVR